MSTDVVYIGSLVVSRTLIDVLAPLVGTLIGGIIAYLATRGVEGYKLRQAKYDLVREQKRKALELTLEWIDPIKSAVMKTEGMTYAYIHDGISEEEYRADCPDLVHDLVPRDVPAPLRVWLPDGTYSRAHSIHMALDELRHMAIKLKQRERIDHKARLEAFGHYLEMAKQLDSAVRQLEDDLIEKYKATYE